MDLRDFNRYRMSAGGWKKLFERADIDQPYLDKYAKHFVDQKIRLCDVHRLNRECFVALEVNFIGDSLAIQRIAAEIIKAMDEQKNDGLLVDSSKMETSTMRTKRVEPASTATTTSSSSDKKSSSSTSRSSRKRRRHDEDDDDDDRDERSPPAVASTVPEAMAVAFATSSNKARATSTSTSSVPDRLKPIASRLEMKKTVAAVPDKGLSYEVVASNSEDEDEEEEEQADEEEQQEEEEEEVDDRKKKKIKLSTKEKELSRIKFGGDFKVKREVTNEAAKRPDTTEQYKPPSVLKVCILTDSLLSHVKLGSVRFLKPDRAFSTPLAKTFGRVEYGEHFDKLEIKQFSYTGLKAFSRQSNAVYDRDVVYDEMRKEYPDRNDRPKHWYVIIGINDIRNIYEQYSQGMKEDFLDFFRKLREFAPGAKITWLGIGNLWDGHSRRYALDNVRRKLIECSDFPDWLTFEDIASDCTTDDVKDQWGHWTTPYIIEIASRLVGKIKELAKDVFERQPAIERTTNAASSVETSIAKAIFSSKSTSDSTSIKKRIQLEPKGGTRSSSTLKSAVVLARRKTDGPAITIASSVSKPSNFVTINGKVTRRSTAYDDDEDDEKKEDARRKSAVEYGPRLPSIVSKKERSPSSEKKGSVHSRLGPKPSQSENRGKRPRIEWKLS